MITAKKYSYDVPANGAVRVQVTGRFFRILACLGEIDVVSESVNLERLGAGDGFEKTDFSFVTLKDRTGAVNTVSFVVSDEAFLNAPQTSTVVTANKAPQSASFTNSNPAVTNLSAQLLAGNTARQYLLIQNKDATGSVFVRFGAAATTALGVKIGPGAFWEWDATIPTGSVHAIGDAASNPNVTVVEG